MKYSWLIVLAFAVLATAQDKAPLSAKVAEAKPCLIPIGVVGMDNNSAETVWEKLPAYAELWWINQGRYKFRGVCLATELEKSDWIISWSLDTSKIQHPGYLIGVPQPGITTATTTGVTIGKTTHSTSIGTTGGGTMVVGQEGYQETVDIVTAKLYRRGTNLVLEDFRQSKLPEPVRIAQDKAAGRKAFEELIQYVAKHYTPKFPKSPFHRGDTFVIEEMQDGLDELLALAIRKKKLPIVIVSNPEEAEFILTGFATPPRDRATGL